MVQLTISIGPGNVKSQRVVLFRTISRGYIATFSKVFKSGHDDVIKWKHFTRYWPFLRGIHRSSVNSPQKASDAEL